jgi:hypothetical protein
LKSGRRKTLIQGGSDARFIPDGHLVYILGINLLAVPFDLKNLEVNGGPVPVIEGVLKSTAINTGAAFFAFSNNGTLVSIPGGQPEISRTLAIIDKTGTQNPLPLPMNAFLKPRISPDGRQIAMTIDDSKDSNIWIYDLSGTASMRQLTFAGANSNPVWTPDGQRIVFQSDREGDKGLFWQWADGSGTAERLTTAAKDEDHVAYSFTPDGKTLVFRTSRNDNDILLVPIDGDRKPKALIGGPGTQSGASLSPDGRWIVYASNESGGSAIFVQPFPPTGAKYLVAKGNPYTYNYSSWSPDGKQLYYLEGGVTSGSVAGVAGLSKLMSVDVVTQKGFDISKPTSLFEMITIPGFSRPFDPMPNGKQFLVLLAGGPPSSDAPPPQINVVLNWFTELHQRVPMK